ncbi:MAG: hypothetical protein IPK67_03870 [Planctomycetes bacterium]|nr:hypothetical protein [Planctomycetota bacterium]
MRPTALVSIVSAALLAVAAFAAQSVPTEVQQPGTQPGEVTPPLPSWNCSFCHAYVDPQTEPWYQWQGSMMGHASSDPLFWATLAVAEQDFNGAGDLCLRCHVAPGWLAGRSTPTDGSGLFNSDLDGVTCELCHKLTNPDDSEHIGVQNAPFVANDGGTPKQAFRGSGMYVLWGSFERLGPYNDAVTAPHGWIQSRLHRSSDLCATCHDVSNPITGDLAHNNGAQLPLPVGSFSGVLGAPVTTKAAFKNFPHQYGVVERTSSEHRASELSTLEVAQFHELPAELKSGSLRKTFDAAQLAGTGGDYADGTDRLYSCQSCHMRPTVGAACNMTGAPTRNDLPRHDLTGGNYWMGEAMKWLEAQGRLRVDYPFTPEQIAAIDSGAVRAKETLADAAGLTVIGDTLRIVNRTGHKLITGYPEGRRLWVRTRWYNAQGSLLRTDGEYGAITAVVNGQPRQVDTLLHPHDPKTHLIEANNGMTQQWAQQLLGFGLSASLPLAFDRVSGAVTQTLGGLAASAPGTVFPTLHFALNNEQISDNRIPPYGLSYDEARTYNALPVPPTQFGNPGPGGTYQHWADLPLAPPTRAARGEIELLYQPTSWEYIQFLLLANTGSIANLATTGQDMLDAWLATGMAAPEVIARAQWGVDMPESYCTPKVNSLGCAPGIGWFGKASATAGQGFQIVAKNLRNRRPGLLLYSRAGPATTPFSGGILCLAPPIRRGTIETSGGSPTGNDCSGGLSVDFNAVIAAGVDPGLVAGVAVYAQFWGRDPGFSPPNNTTLTDALAFVIGP